MSDEKVFLSQDELHKVQMIELSALKVVDELCRKHGIKYTLGYGTLIGAVRHQGFIPWDDDIDICLLRDDYMKFKKVCQTELPSTLFYQSHNTDPQYYHLYDKIRVNGTIFKESFQADYNMHQGVYIDIFPIDSLSDDRIIRFIQYRLFHFFRTGLMSKYGVISSRHGVKRIAAQVLRIVYKPFSLDFLYRMANKTATKFNCTKTKQIHNFCSPYRRRDMFDRIIFENYTDIIFAGIKCMAINDYHSVLSSIYGDYMKLPSEDKRCTRHSLVDLKI